MVEKETNSTVLLSQDAETPFPQRIQPSEEQCGIEAAHVSGTSAFIVVREVTRIGKIVWSFNYFPN
jgi:hypothetical protein